MKTNVNLFIALILCAVIGGALYFLARPSQESLGWNPDEMYGDLSRSAYDGSAFTNTTFSGSANGGGVALSMQGGSLSSRTRAKSSRPITIQYPIANSPSPIANSQSPIANGQSPIVYMTSGAEYRSFGGGGNGNMGTAGTFRTNTQSPITNSQLPISNLSSPIAYNPSPISNSQLPIANHPSPIANSQLPIANNPSNMFGYELKTTFGTASYDMMSYYATNGNRINNRFNAPPGMSGEEGDDDGNGYEAWKRWLASLGIQFGEKGEGDNVWNFDNEAAWNSFLLWYRICYQKEYDPNNTTTPPEFTYEQWLQWFTSNGGSHKYGDYTFNFTPVGNIIPLLAMALAYVGCLYIRRRKVIQK